VNPPIMQPRRSCKPHRSWRGASICLRPPLPVDDARTSQPPPTHLWMTDSAPRNRSASRGCGCPSWMPGFPDRRRRSRCWTGGTLCLPPEPRVGATWRRRRVRRRAVPLHARPGGSRSTTSGGPRAHVRLASPGRRPGRGVGRLPGLGESRGRAPQSRAADPSSPMVATDDVIDGVHLIDAVCMIRGFTGAEPAWACMISGGLAGRTISRGRAADARGQTSSL
jgi:hypothetical protein